MIEPIYARIRQRARRIVAQFPPPAFYAECSAANKASLHLFNTHPIIADLKKVVTRQLETDFGHGIDHAVKVTLDAGALMQIEAARADQSDSGARRAMLVVQCAGLLHDIKRKMKDHAIQGANQARKMLSLYPLSEQEIDDVCLAIRNHEAFKQPIQIPAPGSRLVSDCLYDADKFRWGPDNFTDTVWEMVSFLNPPLSVFISHYPQGMASLKKIRSTFRTKTGQKYGPQFIDLGIAIGEELFRVITEEFAPSEP
jgi:HD superfamily phosphohydrolase YqeK